MDTLIRQDNMKSPALRLRQTCSLREADDRCTLSERIEETTDGYADAVPTPYLQGYTIAPTASHTPTPSLCHVVAHDQLEVFRRIAINSLPLDVLALIFDAATECADQRAVGVRGEECYSRALSQTPFILGAVCRRWRAQALAQPGLWTYISAPDNLDLRGATLHLERVELLLSRSRCMPLDVLLFWTLEDDVRDCPWEECFPLEGMIDALSEHSARWRTFELWLPDGVGTDRHVAALDGPLPLLERLCLGPTIAEDCAGGCLPHAPKLLELFSWGPNAFRPADTLGLASLRRLALWYHPSLELMWNIVSAAAPTLEDLLLAADSRDGPDVPDTPLRLPNLRALTLVDGDADGDPFPFLDLVELPALTHLTLTGEMVVPELRTFLERVAPTVRTLTLAGAVEPQHVAPLACLAGVTALRFDNPGGAYGPDCSFSVTARFFAAAADPRSVWPRLASVRLSTMGTFDINDGDGAGALTFLRARIFWPGALRLREFETHGIAPEWVDAEVARLLRARS